MFTSIDNEPPEAWDRAYNAGKPREWKEQQKVAHEVFNGSIVDDKINPSHYKTDTIECIDAIEAMLTPEEFIGFLRGTIMQYDWRYPNKNGIEDLNKSQWYRDKLLAKLKKVDSHE
jgi:hypothetical protein